MRQADCLGKYGRMYLEPNCFVRIPRSERIRINGSAVGDCRIAILYQHVQPGMLLDRTDFFGETRITTGSLIVI